MRDKIKLALNGGKKLTFNEIRQCLCRLDEVPDTPELSNHIMVSIKDMISGIELDSKRDDKGVFRYSIFIPENDESKKPISRPKMKPIESKPIKTSIEICQSFRVGGKIFSTREEAEEYATVSDEEIAKFLAHHGIENKTKGMQAKTIRRWEHFRQKSGVNPP